MSDGLKLLSSVIDNGSVHIVRDLPRELFIEEEATVYDFVRRHYRRYGRVPAVATVEDELGISLPAAEETTEYYIQRVHDRRIYGVLREKFDELRDSLREYDMEAAKGIVDDMRAAVRVNHTGNDIRTIDEAMQDVWQEYQFAHENPGLSGVPSGYPMLDAKTGGYQAGDLVSIVARPEMGKTYILLKQANYAWSVGYNVLVVTMEMSIEQITRRSVALGARVNPDFLRKGMLSTHARRRIEQFQETMAGTERFRLFSGGLKKRTSDVEMLVQEYQPDIVFIDGAYMMHPESTRFLQKNDRVAEVFDDLKRMTLSNNIPVVNTTQFNRTSGKKGKDGSLENVAYTDAISTHSSLVLALQEGEAPYQSARRRLTFIKGREGEKGSIDINFSFSPVNFEQISREEQEEVAAVGSSGLDWMG